MTITTKKTICGTYIVFAKYGDASFAGHNRNRQLAFSSAVRACYKHIESKKT